MIRRLALISIALTALWSPRPAAQEDSTAGCARAAAAAAAGRARATAAATAAAAAAAAAAPAPAPLTEEEVFARKSLDQLNAERPLDDVFFDLDKSEIRDDARPVLQKDADWMKRWTSVLWQSKGTATRAPAPSTTSRSATAAPWPSRTTW